MKRISYSIYGLAAVLLFAGLTGCDDEPTNPTDNSQDVTLAAPPAGQGFQVVIGPFDVPAGTEIQQNFYQKLPTETEVYVTKIEFKFNTGSHHLNIFKSDSLDVPDRVENSFSALQWENWDMVAASQKGDFTWELPAGVAIKLNARQQMDFQSHYVNAATQKSPNNRGKAIVNFWTTAKSNVTHVVGAVFSNNRTVVIPPHTAATFCKVVPSFNHDVNLLLMTGHFHSRGRTFIVGRWDTQNQRLADTIYNSNSWDDPPILRFPSPILIKAGDSLGYIAKFENRSDVEIKFGPHVEYEEHANLFTFYYPGPATGKAVYDFTGGFMVESHPI